MNTVSGKVGTSLSQSLANPNEHGATFSATGIPAGLTLNANGTVSGTPTAAGNHQVDVTKTLNGQRTQVQVAFNIAA